MSNNKPRIVLFLCTGNYYRSRFAEIWFNHLAEKANLNWRATSRALSIELGVYNFGPISRHTREAFVLRGMPLVEPVRGPVGCEVTDLGGADLVVALKEAEHRPMMSRKFPDWADKVEYWHVHDLDLSGPAEAIAEIEALVNSLVERLASGISERQDAKMPR